MHFTIKNNSGENVENLMRLVQYHFMGFSEKDGSWNFVRPIGGSSYPRFHIYLKENPSSQKLQQAGKKAKDIIIDLHLDQTKPIYQGATAHRGEYEGDVVEKEAERVKVFFQEQGGNA
jgi:hypothetical protein